MAEIAPDLGGDGVGFCHCHRVTPATQAVDKRISPINPHPHLQAAVVVSQGRGLLQGGGGAADTRATAPPLIYPTEHGKVVALRSRWGALGEKIGEIACGGLNVGWLTQSNH